MAYSESVINYKMDIYMLITQINDYSITKLFSAVISRVASKLLSQISLVDLRVPNYLVLLLKRNQCFKNSTLLHFYFQIMYKALSKYSLSQLLAHSGFYVFSIVLNTIRMDTCDSNIMQKEKKLLFGFGCPGFTSRNDQFPTKLDRNW